MSLLTTVMNPSLKPWLCSNNRVKGTLNFFFRCILFLQHLSVRVKNNITAPWQHEVLRPCVFAATHANAEEENLTQTTVVIQPFAHYHYKGIKLSPPDFQE